MTVYEKFMNSILKLMLAVLIQITFDNRTAKLETCHPKMCQTLLCLQRGKLDRNLLVAHGGCPPPRSQAGALRPVVVVLLVWYSVVALTRNTLKLSVVILWHCCKDYWYNIYFLFEAFCTCTFIYLFYAVCKIWVFCLLSCQYFAYGFTKF